MTAWPATLSRLADDVSLAIVDIGLPDRSGFDLFRKIRKASSVSVMLLTALSEEIDRVLGLELGADDYLAKPFHPRELLARIRAILRRTNGDMTAKTKTIELAGLRLMPESYRVVVGNQDLGLSGAEFGILRDLMENAGRVLGRDEQINLWRGRDHLAFDRSIDVHISSIRKKLRESGVFTGEIRTVWGAGYLFTVEAEK